MRSFITLLLVRSLIYTCSLAKASSSLIADLRSLDLSPGTHIGLASNSSRFTQRWSSYDSPSYVAAIRPTTDTDIAKIVSFLLLLLVKLLM